MAAIRSQIDLGIRSLDLEVTTANDSVVVILGPCRSNSKAAADFYTERCQPRRKFDFMTCETLNKVCWIVFG